MDDLYDYSYSQDDYDIVAFYLENPIKISAYPGTIEQKRWGFTLAFFEPAYKDISFNLGKACLAWMEQHGY